MTEPISPAFYVVIVTLGVIAIAQYLSLGRRHVPLYVRPPLMALITVLVGENLYYGFGRAMPDLYDDISAWWPGVLAFKAGYILALSSLNLRLQKARHDA